MEGRRRRPLLDCGYPALVHRDAGGANYVPKEFNFLLEEGTLLRIRVQSELAETLKHCANVSHVLLTRLAINEDII